jgi:hypothetical protein
VTGNELGRRLRYLQLATRVWAGGGEFAQRSTDGVRHQALLCNHRRYVELVPAYGRLAESAGAVAVTDVEQLVAELLVTTDLFKSYDPILLERRDFAAMTDWLGTICTRRPAIATDDVDDLDVWRERLFADGVHLQFSSGTTGRPSFVPRDPATLSALRHNGSHYPHPSQARLTGDGEPYDCLLLVPAGDGTGLQGVAAGLTAGADRAHRLDGPVLTAGTARAWASAGERDRSYARCVDFLRRAGEQRRRVLVFGPPFAVHALVEHVLAGPGPIALPAGSTVVTGGGWKGLTEVSAPSLRAALADALAVPAGHVVDVYSTSELNAAMMSCAHDRYHVPPLLEPRVVDDDLVPLPGEDVTGTLAFLDPFALSYPGFLVTGDTGRLVRGRCGCGLEGWSVLGPITRSERVAAKGCAGVAASVQA